jgi:dienelactone hydrolase
MIFKYSFIFILLFSFSTGWTSGQQATYKMNLLVYKDSNGLIKKVESPDDWNKRRQQILDSLQLVMGPFPDISKKVPLDMQIIEEVRIGKLRRLKISFATEKDDRISAYLLIPTDKKGRVPGILCLHPTQPGKEGVAGVNDDSGSHDAYALELARRGYVTLAPDYVSYGGNTFDPYQHGYVSATMKGIWNHMAAVDLLQSLSEVDPERIGCIGHSLGGHNTLFVALFDIRIKAMVSSCGFTSFYKYYGGNLKGWSHQGYMPRIATVYGMNPEKMPFDFSEILGALAPRAVFINAPLNDSNFEVSGVYDCVNAAKPVYELLNAANRIVITSPDVPHDFPDRTREEAYAFFDKELKFH